MPAKRSKQSKAKEDMDIVENLEIQPASKSGHSIPTIDDIVGDKLTAVASEYWAPGATGVNAGKYNESIVKKIYDVELKGEVDTSRLHMLEFSCYLENFLWKHYNEGVCFEHIYSIIVMVNEKFRQNIPIFSLMTANASLFGVLFNHIVGLYMNRLDLLDSNQIVAYVIFLINIFQSLEVPAVRQSILRYLSLPMWKNLSSSRLTRELASNPQINRHWQHLQDIEKSHDGVAEVTTQEEKGEKNKKLKNKRPPVKASIAPPTPDPTVNWENEWFPKLLNNYLETIDTISENSPADKAKILYLERVSELLIDLLSQLPTRRFLKALLEDIHLITRCQHSFFYQHSDGKLFQKLVSIISNYLHFQIDDQTGKELINQEITYENNTRLHKLQQLAFVSYKDILKDLIFSSIGELGKPVILTKYLSQLNLSQLSDIAYKLGYLTDKEYEEVLKLSTTTTTTISTPIDDGASQPATTTATSYLSFEFIIDVLIENLCPKENELLKLNKISLYPSEEMLWDENQLPLGMNYTGNQVLALPKLNLQFLTIHDYLLRNFILFRLESSYEIREDIIDAVKRMGPKTGLGGKTVFGGWSRMSLPLLSISIDEVSKPKLGEIVPAYVTCTVEIDLSRFKGDIRREWESLKEHDVVFLMSIQNPKNEATTLLTSFESERALLAKGKKPRKNKDFQWQEENFDFPEKFGIKYVRGGEIFEVRDEENVTLNDFSKPDERKSGRLGNKRKLRLRLDPAQYYEDMKAGRDCYESLNLLMRRNPKENNFKAILDTIRNLMNMAAIGRAVPLWLHDLLLGYGSPSSAHYRSLPISNSKTIDNNNKSDIIEYDEDIDFIDTFLDEKHIMESFPNAVITFQSTAASTDEGTTSLPPPYRLKIKRSTTANTLEKDQILVQHYQSVNMGPYPEDKPPLNNIRFTPVQVEAIRSGLNKGLTLVVGPPGTGKTDVAVQVICGLYHNHPTQKILLLAHSNAALNDVFEKIMQRNVDPRHLLRLGSGELELRESISKSGAGGKGKGQGEEFSKQGRVHWSLSRRLQLLQQVQKLSASLGISGDFGYTCETASYFQLEHIQSRIEKYYLDSKSKLRIEAADGNCTESESDLQKRVTVKDIFPFQNYFEDAPQPLFSDEREKDVEVAEGCFRHLSKLFEELEDYRAFELLRTQGHRGDYLLTKQARIVAMTCTHAAMTRSRLVELGFKYDSLVMEEAAQVLEVETLIPMLLQDVDVVDGCRLKRVVLIGDHNQLPPVVKHAAFQKYSKFDQSLFTRLIRLGVPATQLDQQGRARPEIAGLYSWRYLSTTSHLGNLRNVMEGSYCTANAGLLHTYQLIDVPEFQGKGEFCPTPYFYQNLGEAEYVVAVFQYMRLLGYPAERITILSTYNGQKSLIQDVIRQRCRNPIFGMPAAVTTVDKYQGQQNDYILLSLVRTESVGHLRDIRRLVVAASRARLGLYVFCRQRLFENCFELSSTFSQLLSRPPVLQLVVGEGYPTSRPVHELPPPESVHLVNDVTAMGILVYQMVQQAQQFSQQMDIVSQHVSPSLPSQSQDVDAAATIEVNAEEVSEEEEDDDVE